MADDTNFRSYRQPDPLARGPQTPAAAGREGANDPLAELARLIGQSDPFADLGRPGTGAAPPRMQGTTGGMPQQPSSMDPGAASFGHEAYAPHHPPHGFEQQPIDTQSYGDPRQGGFQPAYDPAIYGSAPPAAPAYAGQSYYDDPSQMREGDQGYGDEFLDPPPRRRLKLVMVVAGLALVGAGAAFGYRAVFGSDGTSTPPPVIKADTKPSKVVPTPSNEASNKLIYDRVGEPSQGEKVVSREEQPLEVKDASRSASRVVFPGLVPAPERQDQSAAASAPLGSMPPTPASAEPKKVRTVTIRPDQMPADSNAARSAAPAPGSAARTSTAAAIPAPTRPAPASAAPAQVPGANNQAPLSLSPQAAAIDTAPRPAPVRSTASAEPQPTRVASVSSSVEAGSYTVQISSQRSESEAQASFRSLQAKFPSLLGDRQPIIRRADLGDKGIYFRAMVGPFASVDQASQFCSSLKSAGGQCVVQRN